MLRKVTCCVALLQAKRVLLTKSSNKETRNLCSTMTCVNSQQTTSRLPEKGRPRCYAKSPTAQDMFQLIPGLISCTGVSGRWGVLFVHKWSQAAGLLLKCTCTVSVWCGVKCWPRFGIIVFVHRYGWYFCQHHGRFNYLVIRSHLV